METPALMIDAAQPFTPALLAALAQSGLTGVVAVARPLFEGATDASGNVPQKVAVPLTAAESRDIHAARMAILPYANNYGWGDLGNAAVLRAKTQAAIAQAHAIGLPAGGYMGFDLENWNVAVADLAVICGTNRSSDLGGSGIGYWSAGAPASSAWHQGRADNADIARLLLWVARWNGWTNGHPLPAWAPGIDDASVQAWQFSDKGKDGALVVDVSLLRLPLLSVGGTSEGLWLADGSVGSPRTPDVTAARTAVQQAQAALQTADQRLGG